MKHFLSAIVCAVLLAHSGMAIPTRQLAVSAVIAVPSAAASVAAPVVASGTVSASAEEASPTVPYASKNPNRVAWNPGSVSDDPQPIRVTSSGNTLGGVILGPQNVPIDLQNPDLLAPPTTDHGSVGSAKWPMSLSHNRLQTGGWVRQQNVDIMPLATAMAGVDIKLEPGAIRELHWHNTAEWAYVISGYTQITSVNSDGQNFLATVGPGDLWYLPAGIPHSLQATAQSVNGSEFLLVFPDGNFDDSSTFLLTDWLAHVPKEVLAKNFQTEISAFDNIPGSDLYIFPSEPPSPDAQAPEDPNGQIPSPFTFSLSTMAATPLSGGSVKIVDSTIFPASKEIAVAEVTVEPGAMRELHWHPTQDEWGFFLEGHARMTIYASTGIAQTFNYQGGDIAYIPAPYGHYIENIGNTTLKFLEIFNTDKFEDVSLSQWLALTPPSLVQAHLNLDDDLINHLNKTKQVVVGPVSS